MEKTTADVVIEFYRSQQSLGTSPNVSQRSRREMWKIEAKRLGGIVQPVKCHEKELSRGIEGQAQGIMLGKNSEQIGKSETEKSRQQNVWAEDGLEDQCRVVGREEQRPRNPKVLAVARGKDSRERKKRESHSRRKLGSRVLERNAIYNCQL